MQPGLPGQFNSAGKKTALRLAFDGFLDRVAHEIDGVSRRMARAHRHRQMDPAHTIDMKRRDRLDLAVLDRHKRCTFRAAFADVPALQIAAEDNMRPLVENGGLVHMRECPIVVALVDQVFDSARRIVCVSRHSA